MKLWKIIILLLITVGSIFLLKHFLWDNEEESLEKNKVSKKLLKKLKGKIIFQSNRNGSDDIFMIKANGRGLKRITSKKSSDHTPSFSPDGKKMVFASSSSGNKDLFVMDLEKDELSRLVETPEDERDPVWSNDGDRIYFSATKEGNEDIYFYSFSTQKISRVTEERWRQILPGLSPDGKKLALSVNKGWGWHVYLLDLLSRELTQLSDKGGNCRPTWSPDGQNIAFVSTRDDRRGEVYVMNSDGTEVRRITYAGDTHDYDPAWSPDGQHLVYNRATDKKRGPWNLWIIDLNKNQKAQLTDHPSTNKFSDWTL